jgi:CRP-like cAMP-binding protein
MMGILDDGDVEWIVRHGGADSVKAGTVLIAEGKPIESLFIVLDGKLSVRTEANAGQEVATLYAGEVVGEISFVDSSPPSASVVAVRDSHLLTIPRTLLNEKLARDTGFAARFYRAIAIFLAGRLRSTTSRFGYGKQETVDPDELDDESMDHISLARSRFDDLLRRLRVN